MISSNSINTFLKIAAICSFLGALTTALLIFLPNPLAEDFETRTLLYQNKLYIGKLWTLFLHPQFNIIASLGVAHLFLKKYPWQMVVGMLFLLVWAYAEMSQQALLIDPLNQMWRPGYISSDSEIKKQLYMTLIEGAQGISDSKYFLVIYGFGFGSLLFGTAFIQEIGLAKWIGFALLFIGLLSLSSFGRYYLGLDFLNAPVNWSYTYIYPYLQPLVRIAIGIWIFKEIRNHMHRRL